MNILISNDLLINKITFSNIDFHKVVNFNP